jgi:hypothetical protein
MMDTRKVVIACVIIVLVIICVAYIGYETMCMRTRTQKKELGDSYDQPIWIISYLVNPHLAFSEDYSNPLLRVQSLLCSLH